MLTPLELDIMKAVWRKPPITVRDVQESIRPGRHLAYTTVMTIMDRLYHKGSLKRTLQARSYLYEPAIDFAATAVTVLRYRCRESGSQKRDRSDEIPESLALDEDVVAQSLVCQFAVSGQDCRHYPVVLGERICYTIA